jgi:hypothetical protein
MDAWRVWIEQCEAARRIEDDFGTQQALDYLVGEKFLDFLGYAETRPEFRADIPPFAAEIKTIFEPWQLAQYLETARQSEPFDAGIYDDEEPEVVEDERQADLRRCARDLLAVERAKEWLLEQDEE